MVPQFLKATALAVAFAGGFSPFSKDIPFPEVARGHIAAESAYAQVTNTRMGDLHYGALLAFYVSQVRGYYGCHLSFTQTGNVARNGTQSSPNQANSHAFTGDGVTFNYGTFSGDVVPSGSGVKRYMDVVNGLDSYDGSSRFPGFLDDGTTVSAGSGPWLTLEKLYDVTKSNGASGVTIPAFSCIYLRTGQTITGLLNTWGKTAGGTDYGTYFFGAWGDPNLAPPVVQWRELSRSGSVGQGTMIYVRGIGTQNGGATFVNIKFDAQNHQTLALGTITGGTPAIGDVLTVANTGAQFTIVDIPTFGSNQVTVSNFILTATNTTYNTVSGSGQPAFSQSMVYPNAPITSNTGWSSTFLNSTSGLNGYIAAGVGASAGTAFYNCQFWNIPNNALSPNADTSVGFLAQNNYIQDCQVGWVKGSGIGSNNGLILYKSNSVITCGRDRATAHALYMISATSGTLVNYNYVYQGSDNGVTLHGVSTNPTYEDNFFEECGNGMGMGPGSFSSDETTTGVLIQRNIILNSGKNGPYYNGAGTGIYLAAHVNGVVRNNLIINSNNVGINPDGDRTASAPFDSAQNTNLQIYNNTTYGSVFTELQIGGISAAPSPQVSISVQNNIFYSLSATQPTLLRYVSETMLDSNILLNNNLYFSPSKGTTNIAWKGVNYTLAGLTAFDATKEPNGTYADPLFLNIQTTATGVAPNRKLVGNYKQATAGKVTGANLSLLADLNKSPRAVQNVGCYV